MRSPSPRLVLVLVLALSLPALARPHHADPSKPAPVLASLQRTGCFGWCPAYTVTVREDGTVEYEGRSFVKVKGLREAKLDAKQLAALRAAFADANFLHLDAAKFDCFEATDNPTSTVVYRSGGHERSLRHYYGCLSAPKTMTELEHRIDVIVGTEKWVGTRQERRDAKDHFR